MRFFKPIFGVILFLSLILNVILYTKYRSRRALITINGQAVTKADMDGTLEQQYGALYKANIVRRLLIDQEAHQKGVAPTDQEVEEEFNKRKEADWQYAQRLTNAPWEIDEAKAAIREEMEQKQLLAYDIKVTDEEIKEEYAAHPVLYDEANRAHGELVAVLNDSRTEDIHRLMAQTQPHITAETIRQNFPNEVLFLGDNGKFTFFQALGTQTNHDLFSMQSGEARVMPAGELQALLGARRLVVRLNEIIPGHRADLNDPLVLKKIRLNVALRRAPPAQELLSNLLAKAKVDYDDPGDKERVERFFFPEGARPAPK